MVVQYSCSSQTVQHSLPPGELETINSTSAYSPLDNLLSLIHVFTSCNLQFSSPYCIHTG